MLLVKNLEKQTEIILTYLWSQFVNTYTTTQSHYLSLYCTMMEIWLCVYSIKLVWLLKKVILNIYAIVIKILLALQLEWDHTF